MIRKLAILGATGDLTARYLLPGLAALRAAGELSDNFQLVAVGREHWTDETFRNWAAAQLERHATELPASAKRTVAATSRYHQADVTDPSSMTAVVQGPKPIAAYLALPPSVFPGAVSSLHRAGTAPGSIVVLEKPFGEDLAGAIELNRQLSSTSWGRGLPTASSSRSGTVPTSPAWTSSGTNRWRWRAEPATTTASERSRTCCRTISCSSCVWSPWSRRSASVTVICATARSTSCAPFAR